MTRLISLMVLGFCVAGCFPVPQGTNETPPSPEEVGAPADPFIASDLPAETAEVVEPEEETTLEELVLKATQLGTTVVSLGNAGEPGLWLKTPLAKSRQAGRVTHPTTGKTVDLQLIPLDGPLTAGSRMSVDALRAIGASLTDLTELRVARLDPA